MSHTGHQTIKCSCGVILATCRCMEPDKLVTVRVAGCDDCKKKLAESITDAKKD